MAESAIFCVTTVMSLPIMVGLFIVYFIGLLFIGGFIVYVPFGEKPFKVFLWVMSGGYWLTYFIGLIQ